MSGQWTGYAHDGEKRAGILSEAGYAPFEVVAKLVGLATSGPPSWGDVSLDAYILSSVMLRSVATMECVNSELVGMWCRDVVAKLPLGGWVIDTREIIGWICFQPLSSRLRQMQPWSVNHASEN
jgi:hypothetical protein